MDLKEIERLMDEMVASHGWYDPSSPRQQTPRNMAISLSLESNEVLEHFQWGDQIKDRHALGLELADVLLYLVQLAKLSGINLETALLEKLALNRGREWDKSTDAGI